MANNNNFKPENILSADVWKLVNFLIELLEPFYVVTQPCSKKKLITIKCNLSRSSIKNVFWLNHKANSTPSESSFTPLESLAENVEEAFERRFYSTNNSSRIYLHGNNLFLVTTAIDPRYKLNYFPENLKNKLKHCY